MQMPGLRGYVVLSMVLHILLFAAATQYRTESGITQTRPVLVRILPPQRVPPAPVSRQAPEVMDSAPEVFDSLGSGQVAKQDTKEAVAAKPVPREPALPAKEKLQELVPEYKPQDTESVL